MSNRESGDGFSDILIHIEDEDVGIVIEVKYASDGNMEKNVKNALQQITDVRYTESLEQEGIHKIIKYGIACYKKEMQGHDENRRIKYGIERKEFAIGKMADR